MAQASSRLNARGLSGLLAGCLAVLAVATSAAPLAAREADTGPLPLFLAPQQADDTPTPELRRAAQARLAERAAAIVNPNLKWKPHRPVTSVAKTAPPSSTAPERQAAAETAAPVSQPGVASRIPTSEGDDRPMRRAVVRNSRSKLRDEILRVSTQPDPFAEEAEDTPEPALPPDDRQMEDSYGTPPARRPSAQTPREPQTIPYGSDAFPDDTLPRSQITPGGDQGGEYGSDSYVPFVPSTSAEEPGCENDKRECANALRLLQATTLDKLNIDIKVLGQEGRHFPCECALTGVYQPRNWTCINYTWKASSLCHKPLYFEEVQLERYGHSLNPLIQPLWSGVHFFLTIPTLPYQMSLCPPQECQYVLGYYRPGNCAPYMVPPIPLSLEAGLIEAGVIVGGIILIP